MDDYSIVLVISSVFLNTIIILIGIIKIISYLEHRLTKIETLFTTIQKDVDFLFNIYNKKEKK